MLIEVHLVFPVAFIRSLGKPFRPESLERPRLYPPTVLIAIGIAFVGLLTRLVILQSSWNEGIETFEYETIARNLLDGQGYGIENLGTWYETFGSPPFAYLCALVYATFGHSHHVMLVVQAIISAIVVLACYSIGRRLFCPNVGLLAAALVAFHPGLVYMDTHKIHPLSFDATLPGLRVMMSLALKTPCSLKKTVLVGVLHGLFKPRFLL